MELRSQIADLGMDRVDGLQGFFWRTNAIRKYLQQITCHNPEVLVTLMIVCVLLLATLVHAFQPSDYPPPPPVSMEISTPLGGGGGTCLATDSDGGLPRKRGQGVVVHGQLCPRIPHHRPQQRSADGVEHGWHGVGGRLVDQHRVADSLAPRKDLQPSPLLVGLAGGGP